MVVQGLHNGHTYASVGRNYSTSGGKLTTAHAWGKCGPTADLWFHEFADNLSGRRVEYEVFKFSNSPPVVVVIVVRCAAGSAFQSFAALAGATNRFLHPTFNFFDPFVLKNSPKADRATCFELLNVFFRNNVVNTTLGKEYFGNFPKAPACIPRPQHHRRAIRRASFSRYVMYALL